MKLEQTQAWVQEVISNPHHTAAADSPEMEATKLWAIADKIKPSATLSPQERIAIYQRSYIIRLIDCLSHEYKALEHVLGEPTFRHLAQSFLSVHPSSSYNLHQLGALFPTYLQSTLLESLAGAEPEDWQLFAIDMAFYERSFVEVFNGPGFETIPTNDLFATSALKPSPALKLLEVKFPIRDHILGYRNGTNSAIPEPKRCIYVFSRINYRVRSLEISSRERGALQRWIEDASVDCPAEFRERWLLNGIGYT